MAVYETHILYSEYGSDFLGADVMYDPETKITVWCHLKTVMAGNKRTNKTKVEVFWRRAGMPPKTAPDHTVNTRLKGEDVEICRDEGTGLRILVNSHNTEPDPNAPEGMRLTADETVVIPGIFQKA